jgi:UDP-glucose 4-epimerase
MQKKKIIVTGGAGFIGSHTVVELHKAGYAPVIVDNFSNSERFITDRINELCGTNIPVYDCDCTDKMAFAKVFQKEKPEGVIHFAAFKAVGESVTDPLKYYHNNIESLVVVLQLMKEFQISNLVFSSSCTVYGQPDIIPVTEDSPSKNAQSPYGLTKVICEQIIADALASGQPMRSVLLRYFNPIGAHPSGRIGELPRGVPNNLVPYITQTAAGLRESLTVHGNDYATPDGTCIRDYIHVVDLAEAHVRSLEWLSDQDVKSFSEVLNVGTGKGETVLNVVNTFQQTCNTSLPYTVGPRRSGDVEKIWASTEKAERLLRWKPRRTLADSLRDAWNWQLQLSK